MQINFSFILNSQLIKTALFSTRMCSSIDFVLFNKNHPDQNERYKYVSKFNPKIYGKLNNLLNV